MARTNKWEEQARYWRSLPRSATVILMSGIFCLFAAMGLMLGVLNVRGTTVGQAIVQAVIAGGCAMGWGFAGFRRILWLLIAMFPIQFGANVIASQVMKQTPALAIDAAGHAAMMVRLRTEALSAMVLIILAYVLLVIFMRKEGVRIFGTMTEVRLASEVHRALVPAFSRRVGDYEICGTSVPTGQVGGDLVDLIESRGHWTAYVADVSGHGVPAGMTMAMVKSAARMGSPDGKPLSAVLGDLNRVFASLSAPNVFVTFACIAGDGGPNVAFSLAGHLPILHYRKREGRVEERSVLNLPLAIVPDAEFAAATLTCEPGDVLAILTDGLTETADKQERELGLEPLKATLLASAGEKLEEITSRLRATSLARGPQGDDQTVLLVRKVPSAA